MRIIGASEHDPITVPEPAATNDSQLAFSDESECAVTSVSEDAVITGVSKHTVLEHIGDLGSGNKTEHVQPLCSAMTVREDATETCSSMWSRESPGTSLFTEQGCDTILHTGVGRFKTGQSTRFCGEDEDPSSVSQKLTVRTCPTLISHSSQLKNQTTNCECSGQPEETCSGASLLHSDRNSVDVPYTASSRRVSLRFKHGFFAVNVPYMMDSQFQTVKRHFLQDSTINSQYGGRICVTDIELVLSNKVCKFLLS